MCAVFVGTMGSMVLTVLSMTIGIFFIFIGTLKLTPALNTEIYREMRKTFIRSAKVFPLVKQTGWKPNPHMYRKVIGSVEVVSGLTLLAIPGSLKQLANVSLLLIMLNDIYTHYALDEGLERMSPAIVFALLLCCRLIIHLQLRAKQQQQTTTSQFQKKQE